MALLKLLYLRLISPQPLKTNCILITSRSVAIGVLSRKLILCLLTFTLLEHRSHYRMTPERVWKEKKRMLLVQTSFIVDI